MESYVCLKNCTTLCTTTPTLETFITRLYMKGHVGSNTYSVIRMHALCQGKSWHAHLMDIHAHYDVMLHNMKLKYH